MILALCSLRGSSKFKLKFLISTTSTVLCFFILSKYFAMFFFIWIFSSLSCFHFNHLSFYFLYDLTIYVVIRKKALSRSKSRRTTTKVQPATDLAILSLQ